MGPKVCVISARITNPTWRREGGAEPDIVMANLTLLDFGQQQLWRTLGIKYVWRQCCKNSYRAGSGSDNELGTKVLAEKQRIIMPPGFLLLLAECPRMRRNMTDNFVVLKNIPKAGSEWQKKIFSLIFNISNVWPQIRREMPKLGADRGWMRIRKVPGSITVALCNMYGSNTN